jgi:general secretion pathway protein C
MKKPYFIFINCLLIIVGSYLAVEAMYRAGTAKLEDTPVANTSTDAKPRPAEGVQHPLAYYASIADRNLFKVTDEQAKSHETVNVEALEQTDLKLKLWGTVTGDGKGAYAVIEDTLSRSQNLYRKDDTIQGAVVNMILREKIVLRVGAKDQVLEMEKGEGGIGASPPVLPDTGMVSIGEVPAERTVSLDRSQIENAMGDINDLMQQVKIMPHFSDGQPDGFSLTGIRPNSIFRKMGLRNGDIITGVNGEPIQTMEDAMGFYKQLSSSENVSVQMKRRGRENTLNYQIK